MFSVVIELEARFVKVGRCQTRTMTMATKRPSNTSKMTVSSNVLFHFTDKREHLLNILRNNFSARYCPEYGPLEEATEAKHPPPKYARPMVCFCDLPLFLIKDHLTRYGPYGIGMKKTWGMKGGIGPVLYTHKRAYTLKIIKSISSLRRLRNNVMETDPILVSETQWLMNLAKSYEGPCWHRGKFRDRVKFYDEREWRYIPVILHEISDVPAELDYTPGMNLEPYDSLAVG